MAEITEDQMRDAKPIDESSMRTDMGPSARRSIAGMPSARGSVDPSPDMQAQPSGHPFIFNMAEKPLQPDQGVTGIHGETGDPLAREIIGSIATNPLFRGIGAGIKYGAEKLLASKGGQAAAAVEAGAGVTAPTAQEIAAAKAQADSVIAQGFEPLAEKVPEIAEILRKPAELEARASAASAAEKGAETLKPDLIPSKHSVAAAMGLGGFGHGKFAPFAIGADLLRQNAAPIAGKLAPLAKRVAGAESPLSTPQAALLFQAALQGRQ